MYSEVGRSFCTRCWRSVTPSSSTQGRQLSIWMPFSGSWKRFDIKVKGADSDVVSKFFASWESAVLFPEYVARA